MSYAPTYLIDKFLTKNWDDWLEFLCEELDLNRDLDRERLEDEAQYIIDSIFQQ